MEDRSFIPVKRKEYGTCTKHDGITLTWRNLSVYVQEKKTCFSNGREQLQPVNEVLCNGKEAKMK